jgi:hypothetical protein
MARPGYDSSYSRVWTITCFSSCLIKSASKDITNTVIFLNEVYNLFGFLIIFVFYVKVSVAEEHYRATLNSQNCFQFNLPGLNAIEIRWVVSEMKRVKSKAIPVTGRGGPYCCETLRLPHFLDSWLTDGGEVASSTRPPHFTLRNILGTHFC